MKQGPQEQINEDISLLDLFNFPDLPREILLSLARDGPADAATLTQCTGLDFDQIQGALAFLLEEGRVRLLANGRVEAVIGRAKGRSTLPAQLWQALLTTDRLYSEQNIATLRTAIPILQFARSRLIEFADHGPGHALRVKSYATLLGHVMGLNPTEQGLLRAGALFHDVGNAVDRGRHNILSQQTVLRLTANEELPFSAEEAEVIGLLCRWHRCEYDPNRTDILGGDVVRTGLLASILRVADAMDIDQRRSDYSERFYRVLAFFFPQELPFWTSLKEILGVRVCCRPAVELLAINHWREEEATPMRLLYPGDLGPPPAGNESTIQVRLPAAQAEEIIGRLLEACNRREA
jgi:HD domain